MRDVSRQEICDAARGQYAVREVPQGLDLCRFSEPALQYFLQWDHYRLCSHCTPGVRLDFMTDSRQLVFVADIRWIYPRSLGIDLYVDGIFHSALSTPTTSEVLQPQDERFEGVFRWQGTGTAAEWHRITLYFPHLASVYLTMLQLEDHATIQPIPEEPEWLALGDSNTQGGTSENPSCIYSAVSARALGLSLHNRGVGGMIFDADSIPDPLLPHQQPAVITVAYGTNDWGRGREAIEAGHYLSRLRAWYPTVPIHVLSPIFRMNAQADTPTPERNTHGLTFAEYRTALAEIVQEFAGMQYIPAEMLLPSDPRLLIDGLHPTTAGHLCYGLNLATIVRRFWPGPGEALLPIAQGAVG